MKKLFALAAIGALVMPFMTGCGDADEVSGSCSGGVCTCTGNGKICVGKTRIECKDDKLVSQENDSSKCK